MTQHSFPSPNLSIIQMNESSSFFDTPNPVLSKLLKQGNSVSLEHDSTNFKTNIKNESSEFISSFLCSTNEKDKENVIHSGIPIDKINDDRYKAAYINNHIKPVQHNKYWTDTQKVLLIDQQQRSLDERYRLLKAKNSISPQKLYQSKIPLFINGNPGNNSNMKDGNNQITYFNIYNSDNIGIKSNWDLHLKTQRCDNDTETPQIVINQANEDNMYYLGEGIKEFDKNKKSVYNYPWE